MIQKLNTVSKDFSAQLDALLDRETEQDKSIQNRVESIIRQIREEGDNALLDLTRELDGLKVSQIENLRVSEAEVSHAFENLDSDLRNALEHAHNRILAYHQQEVQRSWRTTEPDGTVLGQNILPIEKVGVYVPGGKAAYPSSVLMTVVPAKVAGVKEVTMVVPAQDGQVNPVVLAAAQIAGVDHIYTIGGAQAVAALAYGTETISPVDKIVGPGNAYVAAAKRMVFGQVGIDMIAGPSEVLIVCDETADPDWVAMDMFAQAEHDELAQSIAVTHSSSMADQILKSIGKLLSEMPRKAIIEKSLEHYGAVIETENIEESIEIANRISPEHLELMLENPEAALEKIKNAGAIFCGAFSAESLGDYCAGPNHVLPTSTTARFSSPLGVYDFQKRSSVIMASPTGASEMARTASRLARAEGLVAHARSAEYRLQSEDQ